MPSLPAVLPIALALSLAALPAPARDRIVVSPVYSQLVAVPVPDGFHGDYEAEQAGSYILELVPQGQTVDDWRQMITLTGGKGVAGKVSVVDAATSIAEGYRQACPDTFAVRSLPAPQPKGAVAVFAGWVGCGTVDGHAEAMTFLVLQGQTDLYTLQWAERGPAQATAPDPDPAVWKPRADALGLARLCARVSGEAAPYPSCTE